MNETGRSTEDLTARQQALEEGNLASHEEGLLREGKTQLVGFKLKDQLFAVNIHDVLEIKSLPQITDVFNTPPFVSGVVNIRGDIYAVFDIGQFFDLSRTELTDEKKLIVLQHEGQEAGILADRMAGVRWIDEEDIQSPPPTVAGVSSEWIEGVVQENEDPLIILDIPSIFRSERIAEL